MSSTIEARARDLIHALDCAVNTPLDTPDLDDPMVEQALENLRQACQAAQHTERERAYIDAAVRLHSREGELEVDDDAVVSEGDDDGAYVAAWVWVSTAEAGLDHEEA